MILQWGWRGAISLCLAGQARVGERGGDAHAWAAGAALLDYTALDAARWEGALDGSVWPHCHAWLLGSSTAGGLLGSHLLLCFIVGVDEGVEGLRHGKLRVFLGEGYEWYHGVHCFSELS